LWLFAIFYGYLAYFSHFGMLFEEKSGNPDMYMHITIFNGHVANHFKVGLGGFCSATPNANGKTKMFPIKSSKNFKKVQSN
jgi:hypothetical protein